MGTYKYGRPAALPISSMQPMTPGPVLEKIDRSGYAIVEGVFDDRECNSMLEAASSLVGERSAGRRDALSWPWVQAVSQDARVLSTVEAHLGGDVSAVRAILFDKQPGANWNLGYHQDRAVPFAKQVFADGFVGWSVKDGVPHALAPAWLLERMLAVRISLDDCFDDNGPLRVLPGTHRNGLLDRQEVLAHQSVGGEETCTLARGGVVFMKPLLLHASSEAASPRHRRVLHIEYASAVLPNALAYYDWSQA